MDSRVWSWAFAENQIEIPDAYQTGTITLTQGSATVTGLDTVWTSSLENLQLKVLNNMYTISTVTSNTELTIDRQWARTTTSGNPYTIVKALYTVPSDFRGWYTVIDPTNNWRIWYNFTARDIDRYDPARTSTGNPAVVASSTYDAVTGLPRFEVWPHQLTAKAFRFLYYKVHADISRNQDLPEGVRGNAIVKGALSDLCRWPGVASQPNMMFSLKLADYYEAEFQREVGEMARNDQEIYMTDLWYDSTDLPYAPLDAKFYQTHSI